MGPRTRVTAGHIRGVFGVHSMGCEMMQPCHIWSMLHTRLIKQWDLICIPASSSLDPYMADEVHCPGSFFLKTRVTAEQARGVVGGHAVVCGAIHTYHVWSIHHIKLTKQCGTISIQVSSSLDHYTTSKVHGSSSRVQEPV